MMAKMRAGEVCTAVDQTSRAFAEKTLLKVLINLNIDRLKQCIF